MSDTDPRRQARIALAVLVVVFISNFLDRHILAILAERIKADLRLDDAQLGFLYGTAFAVVYAVFGLPLGRLADAWSRTGVIALGLATWSVMTAVSAFTRTFGQLAAARAGVGIGEASLVAPAHSLLADLFPPRQRARAIALFSGGIYIGAGLGLFIGGMVADRWGWRAAFLVVGLPGLLLALLVRALPEPRSSVVGHPSSVFLRELANVLPPLPLLQLLRRDPRSAGRNIGAVIIIAGLAGLLVRATGSPAQWVVLAIGTYAAVSWKQMLAVNDAGAHEAIFGSRTFRLAVPGLALLSFAGYGVGFWVPPLVIRYHGASAQTAGLILGGAAAASGWLGVVLGGWWADRWRERSARGRLLVPVCTGLLTLPGLAGLVLAPSALVAYLSYGAFAGASSLWIGGGSAAIQDIMPARHRSAAAAMYGLVVTLVGLGLGPWMIGRISVATGDLRTALLCVAASNAVAITLLLLASRSLAADEDARRAAP